MKFPAISTSWRRGNAALLAALLLGAGLAGCSPRPGVGGFSWFDDDQALRIVTPWPKSVRDSLERDFAKWLRERQGDDSIKSASIVWVPISEDESLDRPLRRTSRLPDLLLGGSVASYTRLAAEDQLESLGNGAARPYWLVVRRLAVGMAQSSSPSQHLVLSDPRVDPLTRAWCLDRMNAEDWKIAYANLVDCYGRADLGAGWRSGSARAAFDQGLADETLLEFDVFGELKKFDTSVERDRGRVLYEEGAAIRRQARRMPAARAFLSFLSERRNTQLGPAVEGAITADFDEQSLIADLLGATLVDAQDELRKAGAAVRKAGSPEWAVELLTQLPPWPPASVEKLLKKEGESGMTLVETLIGQIAPEPGLRLWLTQSWLKARKPLDGALLAEIARIEHGRLVREPRFRAWLRAEWTQWARQRYRWVARLAASGVPVVTPRLASDL